MGQCLSGTEEDREARRVDAIITRNNKKLYEQESKVFKLLLLGVGESGKSTIFKQVRQLYGEKWDDTERLKFKDAVYETINHQMWSLVRASVTLGVKMNVSPSEIDPLTFWLSKEDKPADLSYPVTSHVAKQWKTLWNDEGVQELWRRRAEFQIIEAIEYYMDKIDIIAKETDAKKYIPTFDDILRVRVRSTGIAQEYFTMYNTPFLMVDVGGQRSERRKWLHCFDNVLTILYVAAINEYDQTLFEDSNFDRIKEAIKVWKDIVNRDTFQDVGFVLFLNKFDLFEQKVVTYPYRVDGPTGRNQDYHGPDPMKVPESQRTEAINACADHTRNKFLDAIAPRTGYGAITSHFTIATDSKNMDLVFKNCQDQILRTNLVANGFAFNLGN